MARKLFDWIGGFRQLFGESGAPEEFRTWAAISILAGVMERKVWVDVGLGPLYPNLYIMLLAPPGIGKSELTHRVAQFWTRLSTGTADGLHVSPSNMSAAACIDSLTDSERRAYPPNEILEPIRFNHLNICSNELGTLIPAYDPELMNKLTDLYDGHPYSERKRGKDLKISIPSPLVNMIMATTPAHLTNALPEGAWDQGFLSRCLLIFNSQRTIQPLFKKAEGHVELLYDLTHDLVEVFHLMGEMKFSPEAAKALQEWHMQGGPPTPTHPRLMNYNTRRTAHLLKLCMVASANTSDKLIITLSHYQTALGWLLAAEHSMPDIFKALVVNADSKAMEECWHFAYQVYMKEQKPVLEHRLVAFLSERVPVQNVMRMLQVMEGASIFTKELTKHGYGYVPKARRG